MKNYGKELILDVHHCDTSKFNRRDLTFFFNKLCKLLDMIPEDLYFWDYEGEEEFKEVDPDHIVGTSAVQFIRTSNITIHTLDRLARVYLNIFSCKDFEGLKVMILVDEFFNGDIVSNQKITRV